MTLKKAQANSWCQYLQRLFYKSKQISSNINISFQSESNISPFYESKVSRSRDTLNITLDESLEENEANLITVDKIFGKHT